MDTNKYYKFVKIYCYVCEKFEDSLQYSCQRFSNNSEPKLTDQEIMTIYLFAMHYQGIFRIKQIHLFATDDLGNRFRDLGSYQALNNRRDRGPTRDELPCGIALLGLCPRGYRQWARRAGLDAQHYLFRQAYWQGGKGYHR